MYAGVEIVVVRWSVNYQKLGRTTKGSDSSSPMDYPNFLEYFSIFVGHVILLKFEPYDYQIHLRTTRFPNQVVMLTTINLGVISTHGIVDALHMFNIRRITIIKKKNV